MRHQRLESLQESAAAGVADSQPDDRRCLFGVLVEPVREVLVLGDDDGAMLQGIFPDRTIIGISHANVGNVLGLVPVSGKARQRAKAGGN